MSLDLTRQFETAEHDPDDPNPWLALYLDTSLPLPDEVKAALVANTSTRSRQFLLPVLRPLARLSIILFQGLKLFIPNTISWPGVLHKSIYWGLKTFVRPDANYLILRHFHIGSEILKFVASNVDGVDVPLKSLHPRTLRGLIDNTFLQHDLNIYNFIIRLNREMKAKDVTVEAKERPNFDGVTDGPFDLDQSSLPNGWLNFCDLETAIELYTPLYQLFLTDNDFWRACNSLQLDETVALYAGKILGDPSYVGLVNNKHPLVPMTTTQAGYRLLLHGLAAESLHAALVKMKRAHASAAVPAS